MLHTPLTHKRTVETGAIKVLGYRYSFTAWLKQTDLAIQIYGESVQCHIVTESTVWARKWLRANGFYDKGAVDGYLKIRPLLDSPVSFPTSVPCRKCGTRLYSPVSMARGIGPECFVKRGAK